MKRMMSRRKWFFGGMRCGRRQVCGLLRPPLPLPQGRWRASPRAAGCKRGAGRTRQRPGGPLGRSGRRRCVGEAWGCDLCFPGLVELGSCNVGGRVCFSVRGGKQFAWIASGVGGHGSGVARLCGGGVSGSPGEVRVPRGVGLLAAGVCWLPARLVWRGGSVTGVCGRSGGGGRARVAGPGAVRVAGRVWAIGWGMRRDGQGVWGWVGVRCACVHICLPWCFCVVSCRAGGWEEEVAVFRGRSADLSNACAYLMHLLVGRGKRVLQGCAKAHAPEDPVDGVVPAGEGALWSGGGSFRVSGPAYTCVRVVGMAQIQGSAPAERKRRLIHWDRQSIASPRW